MNENQVIEELTSQVKPYAGIMNQSTFSNNIIRQKAGLLKPGTLRKFFEDMGYVKIEGLWQKK